MAKRKSETQKLLENSFAHLSDTYPMVRVRWADAFRMTHGWHPAEDITNMAKGAAWIVSDVGYLLAETDDYIVIAAKVNEDNLYGDITKIPKTWIKIEHLDIKHKKKLTPKKTK